MLTRKLAVMKTLSDIFPDSVLVRSGCGENEVSLIWETLSHLIANSGKNSLLVSPNIEANLEV